MREQAQGRVFYTASRHDERVWSLPEFQGLLKQGILWAVGDQRLSRYRQFIKDRQPLRYEKVDDIPNYEKRETPLLKQLPLSPGDSMKYTQTRADFRLELFASEPDIVNPICMSRDERDRLWVAETVDYPNDVRDGSGNDTIKILEDTDGNGECDRVTVFAAGLNISTSLTFWNDGVIVAQAPDFLFLKDEDGDDKADVKITLSSGEIRGKSHRFGSDRGFFGLNRMAVKSSFFTNLIIIHGALDSKRQGMSSVQLPIVILPSMAVYLRFGYASDAKAMSALPIANRGDFYPITPNVRQVDAMGLYTAGAGYALTSSPNFPVPYHDKMAFIGGQ